MELRTTPILEVTDETIVLKNENGTEVVPADLFQDREGLRVWSSFKNDILPKAGKVPAGTEYRIASLKLLADATDAQIEGTLPEKHLFDETEVCAVVAELISRQPKGEEGILLNDGYSNIFYTENFVVFVGWRGSDWGVFTWGRDGDEWHAGRRVFAPVN